MVGPPYSAPAISQRPEYSIFYVQYVCIYIYIYFISSLIRLYKFGKYKRIRYIVGHCVNNRSVCVCVCVGGAVSMCVCRCVCVGL